MPTAADQQHSKSSSKPKKTIYKYTVPQSKAADDDQMAKKAKKLVRFGPAYGDDTVASKTAKEAAWNHLGDDKGSYLKSIKDIEKVMECYDERIVEELKLKLKPRWRTEFRNTIARDGCFFLQLSLHILGGGEHLGYAETNTYFGKNNNSASLLPDIIFVGNQIPYTVIESLMEQPFFQKVIEDGIKNGTWRRPKGGDLAKLALYKTVVEPQLEKKMTMKKMIMFLLGNQPPPKNPPSDVLEALRNLHLGTAPDNDPTYSEMKKFHDPEAGTDGIPGAGELYKQGIKLVKGQPGITNIRFENWGYCAYLYVPQFAVDARTKFLLINLANRELHLNESERELTSYLRFMRDLARTYQDFKILEKKGIIRVEKKKEEEEEEEELKGNMVHMLDMIVSQHNCNCTLNFRQIRRKIKDYGGPPWKLISFFLGLFTVVQTIFTVLSYCFPPRS